ncbi:MAG: hypothetical protein LBP73_06410, partial [Clostridiales Family XIII bacterium]|nr:hypothetical protein [Clostridiales Family XIII bacterium]
AFLEHSRIYCFGEGPDAAVYIASADLMTRNTADRVEVACPVFDGAIRARIRDMLDIMLRDNTKAWEQLPDGRYIRKRNALSDEPGAEAVNSQKYFVINAKIQHFEDQIPERPHEKRSAFARLKHSVLGVVRALFLRFTRARSRAPGSLTLSALRKPDASKHNIP